MKTQSRYKLRRKGQNWLVFWEFRDGSRGEKEFLSEYAARQWIGEQFYLDREHNERMRRAELPESMGGFPCG